MFHILNIESFLDEVGLPVSKTRLNSRITFSASCSTHDSSFDFLSFQNMFSTVRYIHMIVIEIEYVNMYIHIFINSFLFLRLIIFLWCKFDFFNLDVFLHSYELLYWFTNIYIYMDESGDFHYMMFSVLPLACSIALHHNWRFKCMLQIL